MRHGRSPPTAERTNAPDALRERLAIGPAPGAMDGSGRTCRAKGYRRLRRSVVLATATVSLVPLLVTTALNYLQYRRAIRAEAVQPIARLTLNIKRSLELFLSERRSALDLHRLRPLLRRALRRGCPEPHHRRT